MSADTRINGGPSHVEVGIRPTAATGGLDLSTIGALNRRGAQLAFTEQVVQCVASYAKHHPNIAEIDVVSMATKALDFTRELAGYYLHLHEYPINIAVFGGVKLDEEKHPAKFQQVMELGALAVRYGLGVESGQGPGAMQAALKGAFEEWHRNEAVKKFFPDAPPTIGHRIIISREPPNPFATISESYHHFPVRKLALMGPDTAAFFVVEGGFGTMEELLEILTFSDRNYIPVRPIYLVGKEFWGPAFELIKKSLGPNVRKEVIDCIKIIEPDEFESAVKESAKLADKMRASRQNTKDVELDTLISHKYIDKYSWPQIRVVDAKWAQSLNVGMQPVQELFERSDLSNELAAKLIKVFVDKFYAETVFAELGNTKPVSIFGSQSRFSSLMDRVIALVHEINPAVPVLTRTPNKDVGLRIHRSAMNGVQTTDVHLRYTLSAWGPILSESQALLLLSGGLDTMWAGLTAVVAEQTNKPELARHPKKILFDPSDTVASGFGGISNLVCDPKYAYARPEHGRIIDVVSNGVDAEMFGDLRERLKSVLLN